MGKEIFILAGGIKESRSRWPRGLKRGSAAARLLGLLVRIPPGTWMSLSSECCVLSGRGLCVGPIPRLEESYLVCVCVCICVLECDDVLQKLSSPTMSM